MTAKIAILYKPDPILPPEPSPQHVALIQQTAPGAALVRAREEQDLIQCGADAEVLLTWGMYRPDAFCRAATGLKWVHALSAGIDGLIAVPALRERRVKTTVTKGIHGMPMAEHVLGMMLSFARGLHILRDQQRNHEWHRYYSADEIAGKTVGIVGLGSIGHMVAEKCKALGMKVVGLRRQVMEDKAVDHLYSAQELPALLRESDYVVNILPSTPATFHIIGEEQLRMMKKTAFLINVGRGKTQDEDALVKALKEGWIAGAGLDVYETTPLPASSELWSLPNAILSPNMAALSPYYMDRAIRVFCDNLTRFIQGKELLYEVNWDTGF